MELYGRALADDQANAVALGEVALARYAATGLPTPWTHAGRRFAGVTACPTCPVGL
jgi:hypothetical protein